MGRFAFGEAGHRDGFEGVQGVTFAAHHEPLKTAPLGSVCAPKPFPVPSPYLARYPSLQAPLSVQARELLQACENQAQELQRACQSFQALEKQELQRAPELPLPAREKPQSCDSQPSRVLQLSFEPVLQQNRDLPPNCTPPRSIEPTHAREPPHGLSPSQSLEPPRSFEPPIHERSRSEPRAVDLQQRLADASRALTSARAPAVAPSVGGRPSGTTPRSSGAGLTGRDRMYGSLAARRSDGFDLQPSRVTSLDSSTRSLPGRQSGRGSVDRASAQRKDPAPKRAAPTLEEEQLAEYSDRFIAGYDRGVLLGRGACAVVWMARPQGKQGVVAVKQAAKGDTGKRRCDTEAARKEIQFGSQVFQPGGEPKLSLQQYPGIKHIARLLDYSETKRDIYLVMEYGGTSLTKTAYEIKGEFLRGERLYRVNHLPALQLMKRDPSELRRLLRQLLSALQLLADLRVVHSDIKPDNILIEEGEHHLTAKLIDFGSAYAFESSDSLSLATPEYMPPEALESCASKGSRFSAGPRSRRSTAPAAIGTRAKKASQPWSFDVWSLGAVLLELALGMPLWLSYKCRVADTDRTCTGLFAVPGRDPEKITQKQSEALRQKGVARVLQGAAGVPLGSSGPEFLSQMLAWDPMDRISPEEALNHPWLRNNDISA